MARQDVCRVIGYIRNYFYETDITFDRCGKRNFFSGVLPFIWQVVIVICK